MHTKGPWNYKDGIIFGADNIGVGEVQRKAYPDIADANGKLMAAAPELANALENCMPAIRAYAEKVAQEYGADHDYATMWQSALHKAEQALSKARNSEEGSAKGIQIETYTLPAHWASYLINGDSSGLDNGEIQRILEWLDRHPRQNCVSCSEQPTFERWYDAEGLACNCLEYTFHKEGEA